MSLNLDFSLTLELLAESDAKSNSILKALIPDNVNMPKGLSIHMCQKGSTLIVKIDSHSVSAKTVFSTIDEILEHISISDKVIE